MGCLRSCGVALALGLGLSVGVLPHGVVAVRAEAAGSAVVAAGVQELLDEGNRQWESGRLPEAMDTFNKAQALARQNRDRKSEARAIHGIGNVQSHQGKPLEALKSYEQALLILREVKDRRGEGTTLINIGLVQRDLGQAQEALKSYEQALLILREVKDRRGEGGTLNNIGAVQRDLGQAQEALKSYEQALLIRREVKDRRGEGGTLNNIGNVQRDLGQPQQALKSYEQALLIRREVKDRRGEGTTLIGIGNVQSALGQPREALKSYEQALLIRREVKDRRGEGTTLIGIGNVQSALGQPREALKSYEQALLIRREVKDRRGEGDTLNNIGVVQSALGQAQEALKSYEQALLISREVKDRRGEGTTLNNIGNVQRDLGQPQQALKSYEQALLIRREVKDRRGEGTTLNNIGAVQSDLGQAQEALKSYEQALLIRREVKDRRGEGITLNNIGAVQSDLGQPQEALKSYEQALLIRREVKDRRGEALTLSSFAVLQRDQGQGDLARSQLEQGLTIQLEIRRSLERQNRQSFLNQSQWAANTLVDLLITQQRPAEAFRWLNLFSTVDLGDYGRLIDVQVADPDAQRALSDWRQQQNALQAQRQRLEREANERQLQQLVEQDAAQNRAAEDLIRRYPVIAELLETRPADIERLQAGIPAGTVVLQPALLTKVPKRPDSVALFVLTRGSVQVVSVPMPAKFNDLLESYRQKLEDATSYLQQSQQLYDLLIRPVEQKGLLPAGSRLALITTGKLREIPLETLYDGQSGQYLIEKYPIHYLTRLSRTNTPAPSGVGNAAGSARRALVLANPTPTNRPLPGTEAEAQYLVGAYSGSRELSGSQATLAQFQQQASHYPILHLGTHGCFIAGGCPELGMKPNTLLFANGVQYPIAEAARLGLSNTELLVLAACQTARITNDSDVGLSGLAYVWERAGARAVVASLWSAPDAQSAQLNKAFYANLKAGLDKAEAMRQAKLSLLRSSADGLHPYLWAPFIVIGDAAPLAK